MAVFVGCTLPFIRDDRHALIVFAILARINVMHAVDVLPLGALTDLEGYDGVVVGAPMILGWHRAALRFLRNNRGVFQRIPLAVFVMCMSLTQTGETSVDGVPLYVDERLPTPPETARRLNFRQRYTRLANYVRPILMAARPVKPVSIGVFGGRLDYGRLQWWAVFFAMVIIQAPAGDRRNWTAIRAWAAGLPAALQLETQLADGMAEDQPIGAGDSGLAAARALTASVLD